MAAELPPFPTRPPPQNSRDDIGFGGVSSWDTTYRASVRPASDPSASRTSAEFDTSRLQKTHWTAGNQSEPMISDYSSNYRPHPPAAPPQVRTRDELTATSFTLGDRRRLMESRAFLDKQKVASSAGAAPTPTRSPDLQAAHIQFGYGGSEAWTTTQRASYAGRAPESFEVVNRRSEDGRGARETLSGAAAFGFGRSEMKSAFRAVECAAPPRATGGRASGGVKLGDVSQTRYETESQSTYKRHEVARRDFRGARVARMALYKSQIGEGNRGPMAKTSSYGDTFVEHCGFVPPAQVKPSGRSSLPTGNEADNVYESTTHAAYRPIEPWARAPLDVSLRDSHFALGSDHIRESTSLYHDTFRGEPGSRATPDGEGARDFHTKHHAKAGNATDPADMVSTFQSTFVDHGTRRPRSPCQFTQVQHAIVPADDSLSVRESCMRSDFVPHLNAEVPKPVNILLHESHLVMDSGAPQEWKTTQQDYFQWQRFRFD
jgi:hypothetical protein